jgi:HD-GYP domain-containing protein (c-di-GMP phosphodiesterase class II)
MPMTSTNSQAPPRSPAGKTEEQLLNAFFVLYKTARIIEENNAAFQKQLNNFVRHLRAVAVQQGEVVIKTIHGHYFVNEFMVRFDDTGLSGAADVVSEWRKLGLGGLCFNSTISPDEAARFFKFVAKIKPADHDLDSITARLASHGLSQVRLLSARSLEVDQPKVSEEIRRQFRRIARTSFFRAMTVVEDVMVSTAEDREINTAKTKRVVRNLINQITRDEQSLIELTAIREYDDYTYAHSTNVTVYALVIGVQLGLDRARLSQLGFSALFHDVGKVKLPADLVRKPDAYDENDWVQMQRHPLLGAKTILRNMKLDFHTARAARATFEHHINNDFTGYPVQHYHRRDTNLFSKIISIVDSFDALSSGRVYIRKSLPADVVFKKMRYQMKVKFDPFLLRLFNDIVGTYPAGSLVLLTTDEIALVLTNNEQDPARPYVKIVGNRQGLLAEPMWVDLSSPEHADRKIIRQIDPARYDLQTSDFILND